MSTHTLVVAGLCAVASTSFPGPVFAQEAQTFLTLCNDTRVPIQASYVLDGEENPTQQDIAQSRCSSSSLTSFRGQLRIWASDPSGAAFETKLVYVAPGTRTLVSFALRCDRLRESRSHVCISMR